MYIVANNLPYHEIYDEQAELYGGIDARSNRLVTVYDHDLQPDVASVVHLCGSEMNGQICPRTAIGWDANRFMRK